MPSLPPLSWSFIIGDAPTLLAPGVVIAQKRQPVAVVFADPQNAVIGSVIKLNGQNSFDPNQQAPRTGLDSTTTGGSDVIGAASFALTADDLGRNIVLTGIDAGEYRIYEVVSSTSARLVLAEGEGGVSFVGGANSSWVISDRLYYSWLLTSVPIGSRVGQESLRLLDTDSSLVSFSPDMVGEYFAELTVSNGAYESEPVSIHISVRAILVPHGKGLVPDGKFIWSYLRDVWNQVESKDWFETLWSALIQICGSELLKLYQVDYNKSIRDIQEQFQRRWLAYEPALAIDETTSSFYIGNHCAGTTGSTDQVGVVGKAVIVWTGDTSVTWSATSSFTAGAIVSPTSGNVAFGHYFICTLGGVSGSTEPIWPTGFGEVIADGGARWEMVSITKELVVAQGSVFQNLLNTTIDITYDTEQPANIGTYDVASVDATKQGYLLNPSTTQPDPLANLIAIGQEAHFAFRGTSWTLTGSPGDIRVGDVAHYPSGPNAGFYLITGRTGNVLTVKQSPLSFSDGTTSVSFKPNFYRPVGYKLNVPQELLTDTFSVMHEDGANDVSVVAKDRLITVGAQGYAILRSSVDDGQVVPQTVIVTDNGKVLSGLRGLNWRAPHTLISTSQNFEALGVSSGDLLIFSITDQSNQAVVDVATQVVGVDGFHVGFILTDQFPVAGEIPPIPTKTLVDLVNGFVIGGLLVDRTEAVSFSGEAASLRNEALTSAWQAGYWNLPLTSSDNIVLGKRTFRLHPKTVIRNRKIPVDVNLESVPLLQERIVQPELSTHDGKVFQVKSGVEFEIPRIPISLAENLDYLVDSEFAFDGQMTFDTGSNVVFVEGANFQDRGVISGDSFIISEPEELVGTYYVAAVVDADRIQLSRPVPLATLGTTAIATVRIERKIQGHFLRFSPGVFTAQNAAPERLWAEVSFFSNDDNVEANFGILVGLTREDLESVSTTTSYKQAVAGLMYAYTQGSVVNKIRLGAEILLGLPLVEHRGIIRSIENDFRLDDAGNAVLGRILIEDVDELGVPEGIFRIYTFPIDAESQDLAGIDINPATGVTYVAGDLVEHFASLSKGVQVLDYLNDPNRSMSAIQQLQKFHKIRMRANDNIFSLDELGLVSGFLKKITPHYVSFSIVTATGVGDDVAVEDDLTMKLTISGDILADNPYFALPHAMMYDARQFNGPRVMHYDDGYYWARHVGEDLVTTALVGSPGTPQATTTVTGGLVSPGGGEGPVGVVGDKLLIFDGINAGLFNISTLLDNTATVDDCPSRGFQPATGQKYALLRPLSGQIRRGTLSSATTIVTAEVGLQAEGVAPGDLLVVDRGSGAYTRHRISRVGPVLGSPNLVAGQLEVTPAIGTLSSRPYAIFRTALVEAPFHISTTVTSTGTAYGNLADLLLQGLLEPGDELEVNGGDFGRLAVLDPFRKIFTPVLPAATYTVKVCKKKHPTTPIGYDHVEKFGPQERVDINLRKTTGCVTNGTDTVSFTNIANPQTGGVRPTDFLQLRSGADSSVDVGYGAGIFPIILVTSSNVKVAAALSSSGSFSWKIIRRR